MTRIEDQSPDHAEGLFNALSDPRIYTHLDETPPESVETLRARIARLQSGGPADGSERWFNWTVFHEETTVGYVQATVLSDGRANVAYVLSPAVWGRGIAFDACRLMFAELLRRAAPTRFIADAARGNARSRRLLERLGFHLEEETKDDVFYAADPALIAERLNLSPGSP